MGKLHKINRYLKKPENRDKFSTGWTYGLRVFKKGGIYKTCGNNHAKYVEKVLHEYSGV